MNRQHIPVLCDKMRLIFSSRNRDGIYVDGTVGLGGHSYAILNTSAPDGCVIGIDLDTEALAIAKERLRPFRETGTALINGNFAEMNVLLGKIAPISCRRWCPP